MIFNIIVIAYSIVDVFRVALWDKLAMFWRISK